MVFRGKRPAEAVNEEHVAARPPAWEIDDVLTENDVVNALVLDGGGTHEPQEFRATSARCDHVN